MTSEMLSSQTSDENLDFQNQALILKAEMEKVRFREEGKGNVKLKSGKEILLRDS